MRTRTGTGRIGLRLRALPMWAVLLALFAASPQAAAQQVHQCVDGREVSYQATPCTKGRSLKQWPLAGPAPLPPPTLRPVGGAVQPPVRTRKLRAAPASRATVRRAGQAGPGRGTRLRAGTDTSCESMRAQRAAAYEKAGLKRNFALSRHWDNKVHQACW